MTLGRIPLAPGCEVVVTGEPTVNACAYRRHWFLLDIYFCFGKHSMFVEAPMYIYISSVNCIRGTRGVKIC